MPYAEKMLEMKVANKRMKAKPDFDIPKLPKKKVYKLQGEPINTPFVPNARPLTKSEKKARLKRLYGR